VIVQDGQLYPVEIKKTASPDKSDIRHFQALARFDAPVAEGGIIGLVGQSLPLTATVQSIPAWAI
jgi:hypothetical protein